MLAWRYAVLVYLDEAIKSKVTMLDLSEHELGNDPGTPGMTFRSEARQITVQGRVRLAADCEARKAGAPNRLATTGGDRIKHSQSRMTTVGRL
jgi:hypothetical protein